MGRRLHVLHSFFQFRQDFDWDQCLSKFYTEILFSQKTKQKSDSIASVLEISQFIFLLVKIDGFMEASRQQQYGGQTVRLSL